MSKPAASTLLDFTNKVNFNKPIFKIEPTSVKIGDKFIVRLFAKDSFILESPYNGILGSKKINAKNEEIEEIISLSSPSLKYPIKSISSAIVANSLIDEVSRNIVYTTGMNISNLLHVINQSLTTDLKLIGSVKVKYFTFNAQEWEHKAFKNVGEAVLFVQHELTSEWFTHKINVNEKSTNTKSNALKIEAGRLDRAYFGVHAVYARFRVYPASAKAKIKVDEGRVENRGEKIGKLYAVKVEFNGTDRATADYFIDSLIPGIDPVAFLFDENGNEINTTIKVDAGELVLGKKAFGFVFISYNSAYDDYNYFANTTINTRGDVNTKIGTVFAFSENETTTYNIPEHQRIYKDKVDVLVVSFKILIDDNGEHERPPNYPNDALFPADGGIEDTTLLLDNSIPEKIQVEWVAYDGFRLQSTISEERTKAPFFGQATNSRVYSVEKNYPQNASASLKLDIDENEIALKSKWNIA